MASSDCWFIDCLHNRSSVMEAARPLVTIAYRCYTSITIDVAVIVYIDLHRITRSYVAGCGTLAQASMCISGGSRCGWWSRCEQNYDIAADYPYVFIGFFFVCLRDLFKNKSN